METILIITACLCAIAGGLTGLYVKNQHKIVQLDDALHEADSGPPVAPELPQEKTLPVNPTPMTYDFSTPKKAWHASRVIMDEMGLTGVIDQVTGVPAKDLLCSCIYQESAFIPTAVGKPNSNGTKDYGLCQYNNGTYKGKALWIGPGAVFKDINEVLTNPEKNVRVMVKEYKAGHLKYWASYSTGANKKWLKPGSAMWKLKS